MQAPARSGGPLKTYLQPESHRGSCRFQAARLNSRIWSFYTAPPAGSERAGMQICKVSSRWLLARACRVASSVWISDSRGSLRTMGSMIQPRPNGMSRVSDIARHSRIDAFLLFIESPVRVQPPQEAKAVRRQASPSLSPCRRSRLLQFAWCRNGRTSALVPAPSNTHRDRCRRQR